ncbi:MAG: hypothetical protein R3B93_06585 [Bacteroidia bacterium]
MLLKKDIFNYIHTTGFSYENESEDSHPARDEMLVEIRLISSLLVLFLRRSGRKTGLERGEIHEFLPTFDP